MPYWGALVRTPGFNVTAKMYVDKAEKLADHDSINLKEFLENILKATNSPNDPNDHHKLAKYCADNVTKAFRDHPEVNYVMVDVVTNDQEIFGHIETMGEFEL